MKKFAALGLAAALASMSLAPVQAEEITPIKPAVSTQGSLALGGLGAGAAAAGVLIVAVIVAAASGNTSGTN